jgi:hypothetical protein
MGLHPDTLRRWEREGRIEPVERTPGGRRRYDLLKLRHLAPHLAPSSRTTIAYGRVSTVAQKDVFALTDRRYTTAEILSQRRLAQDSSPRSERGEHMSSTEHVTIEVGDVALTRARKQELALGALSGVREHRARGHDRAVRLAG